MSSAINVRVRPYLRFLPNRRSTPFSRSPYIEPGLTMLKNSTPVSAANSRPRLVSANSSNACATEALGGDAREVVPRHTGRLWNVPLTSTSIFGTLYVASPFKFVCHPDSRWQKACGHCPRPPRNGRGTVRAAPGTEDVELRVLRDHAARVLDDVPGAEPALDRHVAQARVHRHVDAVERVVGAAEIVGERQVVVELVELRRLHVVERQRVVRRRRAAGSVRHVVDERIEIGRRQARLIVACRLPQLRRT